MMTLLRPEPLEPEPPDEPTAELLLGLAIGTLGALVALGLAGRQWWRRA